MVKMLHMASMLVMLHVIALTAALLQPEWACDLGMDLWTLTVREDERFGYPDWSRPNQEELDRASAKERVVTALIEGRLTLFEAAFHFRRLKNPRVDLRANYRGNSEEECLCRQVITFAGSQLRTGGQDAKVSEVIGRLEAELRRHLEQNGKVILPDVGDVPDLPAISLKIL